MCLMIVNLRTLKLVRSSGFLDSVDAEKLYEARMPDLVPGLHCTKTKLWVAVMLTVPNQDMKGRNFCCPM